MAYRDLYTQTVDFTIDEAQLKNLRETLEGIPRAYHRAVSGAIKRTLLKVRTKVIRQLAGILTVKRKNIGKRITVQAYGESGTLKIVAREIGLINFSYSETKYAKIKRDGSIATAGITSRLYKGGPEIRYPHAFVAKGKSGNLHIWERAMEPGGKRAGRLPIERLNGLSLYEVYAQRPALLEEATEGLREELSVQLASQIDRFLGRTQC